jgi:GNAT superfamily N-acetyltransferase
LEQVKWTIRRAQPDDARGIADVQVNSWKTTYAGIIPQKIIEVLSGQQREERWRDILSDSAEKEFVFVATAYHGRIVGFASGEPERKGNPKYRGEISAIYILESYQRLGIGRRLVSAVAAELLRRGIPTLLIRVLAANPACGFFEALGGRKLFESEVRIGGAEYPDVAYGWDVIGKLVVPE